MKSEIDEKSLLIAAKAGDADAENELMLLYKGFVLHLSRSFFAAHPDCDPDDLAQDGMIGLMKAIRHFDPEVGASFKTFAATCVKNELASSLLHKKTVNTVELEDVEGAGDPEADVIENEKATELYFGIASTLNETELEVFKLFLNSMTYDEIAAELGIEKKKVDNTLFALRKKIKKLLDKGKK